MITRKADPQIEVHQAIYLASDSAVQMHLANAMPERLQKLLAVMTH
tara:strand:+ start:485 stop:622 length:138 start_codon:yes stop_codon:yes gene_type:complete